MEWRSGVEGTARKIMKR